MKVTLVLLLLALTSLSVKAQSKGQDAALCPLSHWSKTGAACEYAPDLPPSVEQDLKMGRSPMRKARPVFIPQSAISPIDSLRIFNPDFIIRRTFPNIGEPKISLPSR